ncbi:MAG TPA: dNTP triphosphohydrolase, partial [Planctomicrobium sp.]|nr:dNTP triphosphohydrolase [Planctomicrobium sp.]
MPHRLCWEKLLSPKRVPFLRTSESRTDKDKVVKDPDERSPFEQDYDRIVFSAPFRRLARKTQVHPMASNDHIHNRLTHSIEVASVGRSFAVRVAKIATERSDLKTENLPDLTWILQSACLIHDLGNPPFGHAGEEVVREWSHEHESLLFPESRFLSKEERQACRSDWLHFEGNAQGFRFSARADNPISGYLRLTYATLGAAIKYPWPSNDPRAERKRKHNIYSTELDLFRDMATD